MPNKKPQNLAKILKHLNRNVNKSGPIQKPGVNPSSRRDNIIDFGKSIIVAIVAPIIATLILSNLQLSCKREPSPIEEAQEKMKLLEQQLNQHATGADTTLFNNRAKWIHFKRFQDDISYLSHYASSHEKNNFKGISLQESLDLAIDNLSKRNIFDQLSLNIIAEIDSLNKVYQHPLYDYEKKKEMMEESVHKWVHKDTLRNNRLIGMLKQNRNSSSKIMKASLKEVNKELTSLNEDIDHYYYKVNLYDYIIEIRNLCLLKSNESETLDMNNH